MQAGETRFVFFQALMTIDIGALRVYGDPEPLNAGADYNWQLFETGGDSFNRQNRPKLAKTLVRRTGALHRGAFLNHRSSPFSASASLALQQPVAGIPNSADT
jgi:hypothetical protein